MDWKEKKACTHFANDYVNEQICLNANMKHVTLIKSFDLKRHSDGQLAGKIINDYLFTLLA